MKSTRWRNDPPAQFTYKGHRIEIVAPDTKRLIENQWQIKIDGVLKHDLLFSSLRLAAERAEELINQERGKRNISSFSEPQMT